MVHAAARTYVILLAAVVGHLLSQKRQQFCGGNLASRLALIPTVTTCNMSSTMKDTTILCFLERQRFYAAYIERDIRILVEQKFTTALPLSRESSSWIIPLWVIVPLHPILPSFISSVPVDIKSSFQNYRLSKVRSFLLPPPW